MTPARPRAATGTPAAAGPTSAAAVCSSRLLTRRTAIGHLARATFLPALALPLRTVAAEQQPTPAEHAAMNQIAAEFMTRFGIPGFSVAIAAHGSLVYQHAFGFADVDRHEAATPQHLFRIASLSKPITAAAVFSLIEQGKCRLNEPVFGPDGILRTFSGIAADIGSITVHHLLTHTCGGWSNHGRDPMFQQPAMNQHDLIQWTINNIPLQHPPGTTYAYSNFGYCLLGRMIEVKTGKSYADYCRDAILTPCGIDSMRISGDTLLDRVPHEVIYYPDGKADPYTMKIRRMDAHGGWLATPTDLVRFALRIDGFASPSDLLQPTTVTAMTTPTKANPQYACGWSVNAAGNWWHTGSLPGTSSILVRTGSGLCWAGITNIRAKDIGPALDAVMWKLAKSVPAWQA